MKVKSGYFTIALVSIILGLMLAVQYKVTEGNPNDSSTRRMQELVVELKQTKEERDNLKSEVDELRLSLDKAIVGQSQSNEALLTELDKARQAAGLEAVKGPGVIVTLNDSTRTLQPGEDPNLYLIHDEDILKVVNELKAAGAEAIAVNEQRILATSEIRCAGPTIQVNGNRIAPPFTITGIGDPVYLENSLRIKGGVLENLNFWGIQIKVEQANELTIPGYHGTIRFKYASTAKER